MKQYRILIVLFVLFFLLFFVLENRHSEAQGSSTFTGKLDPELVPDMVHVYSRVLNAVKTHRSIVLRRQLEKARS